MLVDIIMSQMTKSFVNSTKMVRAMKTINRGHMVAITKQNSRYCSANGLDFIPCYQHSRVIMGMLLGILSFPPSQTFLPFAKALESLVTI